MVPRARALSLSLMVVLVTALLAVAPPATGQTAETTGPNYTVWNALARLAETTLDNPDATEEVLTAIRTEVAEMRAQFLEARAAQEDRIAALREQIAALGPVPEEGGTPEAVEITERRTELNTLLAEREAPRLAADEAFTRADGIIRAIDRVLRTRQADALMSLGPLPINPANWLAGLNALISSGYTVYGEVVNAWLDPARRQEFITDLPITLGALLLAAVLLLRGRHWMEQLTEHLLASTSLLRGRTVAAFFLSLSQLLVPFAGLLLLATAIQLTAMTGPTLNNLADALVPAGMAVFFARWLSLHVFPVHENRRTALHLDADDRRRGRTQALVLGLLVGIETLLIPFVAPQSQSPEAVAVLMFPLLLLASLSLWRLSRIIRRHIPRQVDTDGVQNDASPFFDRMIRIFGNVLTVMALVAPLLAAVGYLTAAQQIIYPAVDSLALIGLAMVLHRLITAIYATVIGDEDGAADGLVPALAGLLLSLASLAPLALIWGARETDLWEIWARFSEGVSLGETRISPTNILTFFIIFAAGFLTTRVLQGALGTSVLPKTTMEKGAQKAIVSGVGYIGITLAGLAAFSWAGIDLSGLAIVAGALSVGIGFGLQNIVSNFVSGIILLIERPVSEGDWVQVNSIHGTIERISVRSTVIQAFDRSKVIVPNADLISNAVTNYTKSSKTGRLIVPVGVAYGTDTRTVEGILREVAESEALVTLDPPPSILFRGFGADSLNFEIRVILRDVNYILSVESEINHKIAARFTEAGIEIPFAQRDIWLRNPEALLRTPPAATPDPDDTVEQTETIAPPEHPEHPDDPDPEFDR